MKRRLGCIVFHFFVILIVAGYVQFIQIKNTTAYDCMVPGFEVDNLYTSQVENIPAEHRQFYEKIRYFTFKSDNISGKDYRIDFDDIPFNSLKGFPGKYRYFMDSGSVYDTSEKNKGLIGKFTAVLIRVEEVHLRNNKIELSFEFQDNDLMCSYVKLVYLSLNGKEKIKYIPIGDQRSIVINSNENGNFLKTIYLFSSTKNEPMLNCHLSDPYNHMEIE